MKIMFAKRSVQVLCCLCLSAGAAQAQDAGLVLHYDRPAQYFEEALVIGNGTMGAIVYGGTARDVLSLNDLTLWTGEPDRKVTTPDAHLAIPVIRENWIGKTTAVPTRNSGRYRDTTVRTISRWDSWPSPIWMRRLQLRPTGARWISARP